MYLARTEVTSMNMQAAAKLARVHFAKKRHDRTFSSSSIQDGPEQWDRPASSHVPPPHDPMAAELPAEDVVPGVDTVVGPRQYVHRGSLANAKYSIFPDEAHSRPMDSPLVGQHMSHRNSRSTVDSARRSNSSVNVVSPQPGHDQQNWGQPPPPPSYGSQGSPKQSAPPLPPKTPLPYPNGEHAPRTFTNASDPRRHPAYRDERNGLPYPDTEGPPPAVNMARKPEFGVR